MSVNYCEMDTFDIYLDSAHDCIENPDPWVNIYMSLNKNENTPLYLLQWLRMIINANSSIDLDKYIESEKVMEISNELIEKNKEAYTALANL